MNLTNSFGSHISTAGPFMSLQCEALLVSDLIIRLALKTSVIVELKNLIKWNEKLMRLSSNLLMCNYCQH